MPNFNFLAPADAELWPLTDGQRYMYSCSPATKNNNYNIRNRNKTEKKIKKRIVGSDHLSLTETQAKFPSSQNQRYDSYHHQN